MMKITIALLVAFAGLAYAHPANAQEQNAITLGARAWARNCTRCHNARPSSERTDRQWETIVAHMRARGNLTKAEATNIAEYLKATNAPETVVVTSPMVPEPPDPATVGRAGPDGRPLPSQTGAKKAGDRRSGGGT